MPYLLRLCCALAAALVLNVAFSSAQTASAANFTVNSGGDAADSAPGNGACADSTGACTLRAAIQEANTLPGNDTITISVAGTINLTGALPDITSNMNINGPGSSLLTVRRDTGGDYRIFFTNNVNVNISGMTITNGRTPDGVAAVGYTSRPGGGIWQGGGSMELTDVVITGNRTGNGGARDDGFTAGWGGDGGGISGSGRLTLTNVVVSNNATGNGGRGYYGGSGGGGGGIYFGAGELTLTNVVVSGNTTGNAGETTSGGLGGNGGNGGGIFASSGTLNLSNITVSDNSAGNGDAGGHGGGIFIMPGVTTTMRDSAVSRNGTGMGSTKFAAQGGSGGGIVNHGSMKMSGCLVSGNITRGAGGSGGSTAGGGIHNANTLTMTNSTVSGNHADPATGRGGGIYNSANALTLTNVTITENSAYTCCSYQNGQGIHNSGTVNVRNTIIANNGGGKVPYPGGRPVPDATGKFNSLGHNFVGRTYSGNDGNGDQSGFANGVNGDQVGVNVEVAFDPKLGPLASNGGPTQTHAPLAGSPVLDAGNNSLALDANNNVLTTDQRGSSRIADSTGTGSTAKVDIGAYELNPFLQNVVDQETQEDIQLSVLFNIGDADINPASINASSDNGALVADANLSITGSGPMRTLRITPAANLSGVAVITLTVNGADGRVTSDTFQLTVTPVNDAPTFTIGANQTVNEDSGAVTIANWATDLSVGPNESGQSLVFVVNSNSPASLFSVAPSISPSGALTFTPAPNANGSAEINVSLKDDGGTANGGRDTSDRQTFTINVLPVNDAPVAVNNNYGTNEDTPVTVFAPGVISNDTDVDRTTLVAELVSATNNGTVTLAASGSFTYTPNANFNGADSFTYRVSDGIDWSNVATVSLNVFAINDAPVNTVPNVRQIAGTTPLVFSAANGNRISIADIDAGNNLVRVTLNAFNGAITLKTTAGLNFSTGNGTANSAMIFTGSLADINAALEGSSFIPRSNYSGAASIQIVTNDLGNTGSFALSDTDTINITILPGGILQFSAATYQSSENDARAVITVTRSGDISSPVLVNFATVDDPAEVPCDPTLRRPDGTPYPRGAAFARCDYATTIETVAFAVGDAQPKTINIPLVDDAHDEGTETVQVRLFNARGATLGAQPTATLTINDDNDVTGEPNPIFSTSFFVRMQYLDFLSREPEAGEPWSNVLFRCADVNADPSCDRILVSQSFFGSPEFRLKGFYVFNFYRVAFGRRPTYEEIIPDMRNVTGATEQEVYQKRAAFPVGFAARAEFKGLYDALSDTAFVDALLDRYQLQQINASDPANPESGTKVVLTRAALVSRLGASGAQSLTRAQVLRAVVESNEIGSAEYNRAFVAMQYYGYLRRSPEEDGYQAWLRVINQDPNNVRAMVNGFMNSTEYKLRFGRAQ